MTENQLTKGFNPGQIVGPDPERFRVFLSRLADGKKPLEAALEAGISPGMANALVNQPAFRAQLDLEIEQRLHVRLVPKALAVTEELLAADVDRVMAGLPVVKDGVKARLALGVLAHAHKMSEAGKEGDKTPLHRMSADQLQGRLEALKREEATLSGAIEAEFVEIPPIKGTHS